jgi:hypothetical protein
MGVSATNRTVLIFAIACALCLCGKSATATAIFSQTPSTATGSLSDLGGNFQVADDFTLSAADTAQSVTWRGFYSAADTPVFPQAFNLAIYGQNGGTGLPDENNILSGTTVTFNNISEVTNTGLVVQGHTLYEFRANIMPVALSASTAYWFSPVADTSSDTDDNWFWATGLSGQAAASRAPLAGGPFAGFNNGPFWFVLDNAAIPEPAGIATLVTLASSALLRRRRSRS